MSRDDEPSLSGIAVVITRSREQNAALRKLLESRGAGVVDLPTLRFVAVSPADSVRKSLHAFKNYTHLVFTSQTAVEFFAKACSETGISPDTWRQIDIAAVGPATASALDEQGLTASIVTDGSGETLAAELLDSGGVNSNSHVLVPQSAIARPELEQALTAAGARVTALSVYDTSTEASECAESFLAHMKNDTPPDAILFASPSAVNAFLELTGHVGEEFLERGETRVISIGPTSSAAIRKRGYEVSSEASQPGIDGLVTALEGAVRNGPPPV